MFKRKKERSKIIRCYKCHTKFTEDEIVQQGKYGNDWIDLCPYCNSFLS